MCLPDLGALSPNGFVVSKACVIGRVNGFHFSPWNFRFLASVKNYSKSGVSLPCGHCPIQWKWLFPERSQWSLIGRYCVQGGGNSDFSFSFVCLFVSVTIVIILHHVSCWESKSHFVCKIYFSNQGYTLCHVVKAAKVSNKLHKVILSFGKK